jgi:hypothetical protein
MAERTFRVRLTDIREEIAGIRALTKDATAQPFAESWRMSRKSGLRFSEKDMRKRKNLGDDACDPARPCIRCSAVIAREGGRSSNRQTMISGCPAFA